MRISDWSSDVCSSDLQKAQQIGAIRQTGPSTFVRCKRIAVVAVQSHTRDAGRNPSAIFRNCPYSHFLMFILPLSAFAMLSSFALASVAWWFFVVPCLFLVSYSFFFLLSFFSFFSFFLSFFLS